MIIFLSFQFDQQEMKLNVSNISCTVASFPAIVIFPKVCTPEDASPVSVSDILMRFEF